VSVLDSFLPCSRELKNAFLNRTFNHLE
jgi:hypothetical protein